MIDPDLLKEFIEEAGEHLASAEDDVLALEREGADADEETVNRLFRALHTVKGGAGFLNMVKIKELSHSLENVIGRVRSKTLEPAKNVVDCLLDGIDRLKALIDDPGNDSVDISTQISACESCVEGNNVQEQPESSSQAANATKKAVFDLTKYDLEGACNGDLFVYELTLDLVKECSEQSRSPQQFLEDVGSVGLVWDSQPRLESMKNVKPGKDGSALCTLLLATVIDEPDMLTIGLGMAPLNVRVYRPEDLSSASATQENASPSQSAPEPELAPKPSPEKHEPTSAPSAPAGPAVPKASAPKAEQTVRISLPLLDKLMNMTSELVLVRNQNTQALNAADMQQLATVNQQLNVVTSELQACVMQTRMRPVGTVFNRFSRVVRDLAKKLGKEIELVVTGADVELDKSIIESIGDPLTHIVRNAVDHGIESPEERKAKGKSPVGDLRLQAFHEAGHVNIQMVDDGKGIDPVKIKAAAIEKGVISKQQAEVMQDRDAYGLIFEAGFSMAKEVTDVSGRGVGMDVVKSGLQRVGGAIDIVSVVDKGTTISIKLPLTLAIIPTLVVSIERNCFAIPQVNIEEVVWLHGAAMFQDIQIVDDREVYWLRGKLLPLVRLSEVLGLAKTYVNSETNEVVPDRRAQRADRRQDSSSTDERRDGPKERRVSVDNSLYIIVVQLGAEQFGLVVDTIVDTEEIVVKPLHDQLKDSRVFAGTTVLGDGRIALILDIAALADRAAIRFVNIESDTRVHRGSDDDRQTVLLYSVGGEEHFAVPLALVTRVEEIKPSAIQLANGKEFLDFRGEIIPLVRMESALPGISSSYDDECQYVIVPKAGKTVGIVASSILDTVDVSSKLESQAISPPVTIGSQLLNGKVTLFVDLLAAVEKSMPQWFATQSDGVAVAVDVLVVEDSSFYRALIASYLRGAGMNVTIATNGREALDACQAREFAAIVSDLEMPVMDGFEFAKALRERGNAAGTHLVAISAADEEYMRPRATDAGFDDFHSKNNLDAMLLAIVKNCEVEGSGAV